MRSYSGCLIVFEGTDGTGKSTQLNLAAQALRRAGHDVVATREPTNGSYGQKIRELYQNRNKYSPQEELELFLADRREHVAELLLPSLQAGKIVLCDRYFLSTVAYQGALGLDIGLLFKKNGFAPSPDLALIFHAPVQISIERITKGRGEQPNDFERIEFLEKVSDIFYNMKQSYIVRIDATLSPIAVQKDVMKNISALLAAMPSTF